MLRTVYVVMAFPLLFQKTNAEISKNVPVFIFDNERSLSSVIPSKISSATLNQVEFSDIVRYASTKSDRVIIFVEDTLSAEDISSRDQNGSPYYLLRQGLIEGSIKHFPSVDSPFSVLNHHVPMTELNTFHLDSKTSKLSLYESNLRHFYVFFKDHFNMSRVDSLRQHDLIMREVPYVMRHRANGPVVAFYTGKINQNGVNMAQNSPFAWETRQDAIWCRHPKAILAVEGIRILHKNEVVTLPPMDLGEVACAYHWNQKENPSDVTVEMPLKTYTLQCRLTYNDVTWTLENCHLRQQTGVVGLRGSEGSRLLFGRTLRYANAFQYDKPFEFRMNDGESIAVNKITVEVLSRPDQKKFSIQIQSDADRPSNIQNGTPAGTHNGIPIGYPNKESLADKEKKEEYTFTEPVLTCLVISSILLSILIYGFTSLASVRTNSRYDDPKGKPLMFAES